MDEELERGNCALARWELAAAALDGDGGLRSGVAGHLREAHRLEVVLARQPVGERAHPRDAAPRVDAQHKGGVRVCADARPARVSDCSGPRAGRLEFEARRSRDAKAARIGRAHKGRRLLPDDRIAARLAHLRHRGLVRLARGHAPPVVRAEPRV